MSDGPTFCNWFILGNILHGLEIFADKLHGLNGFAYRLQSLERFPDPNILESYAEGLHVLSSSKIFTGSLCIFYSIRCSKLIQLKLLC